MLQQMTHLEDGSVMSISASANSDALAPLREDQVVRSILYGEYLSLEALDGGKRTKLTRLSKVDPGGSLPIKLVNFLIKGNAKSLVLAKKILEKE